MYDVIIIGKGPAGISASLYTVRANLNTLVIGRGSSALVKAGKVENYYGFSEPVSGELLLREGEKQALRLGAHLIDDEVIAIEDSEFFEVVTASGRYEGKAILLATGQTLKTLKISGLQGFEGKGVSYCTTCDGFFYNNLKVGVLGFKDYAVHEAKELEAFTRDITIFTNGRQLEISDKFQNDMKEFKVNQKIISKLSGSDFLQRIHFDDDTSEELDGLFVAYESASSSDFARKLGILTEGNSITVDKNQRTNLEGVFAAGDCTGGFRQISTAVGQGALAGRRIIEYLRSKKQV
jgi:thioredoxin reductase (NADPH)